MYAARGKRWLDLVASTTALLVLSPLLAVVAVAIRLEDGGPVLFRQTRIGKDAQPFTVLKFRSTPVGTGDVPSADSRTLRVTRVGSLIRRTNIDELPQLWNIIRGDMSLVGPRPALPSQRGLIHLRAAVGVDALRPELTGLAQVSAYDGMDEAEKARFDSDYSSQMSLRTDLLIILRTFGYLLRRPPVY